MDLQTREAKMYLSSLNLQRSSLKTALKEVSTFLETKLIKERHLNILTVQMS